MVYNRWSTDDALAHLKFSLTGNALQLLRESPFHDFTFEELVDKLKQRFGSVGQSQKFRAELKSRRRQKGESIQSVYADVCRLLSLAYPNQFELPTTQEVGIDLFLEALEDLTLERRVRERELSTLDETFRYCLKLEAYDKAIAMRSDSRRQPMHAARNMHENPDPAMELVKKQLDKILLGQQQAEEKYKRLESNYQDLKSSLCKSKNNRDELKLDSTGKDFPPVYAEYKNTPAQETNKKFPKKNLRCFNCNRYGHISKECRQSRRDKTDKLVTTDSRINERNSSEQNFNANRVGGMFDTSTEDQEVYLLARIDGKEHRCLLDSGCELSILPYELVKDYHLMPSYRRMRSANDVAIPVLGEVEVELELERLTLKVRFLVSNNISEIMLGFDFLKQHGIRWDFQKRTIKLNGHEIALCSSRETSWVRKLVLSYDVRIPPRSEVNLPGTVLVRRITSSEAWMTNTYEIKSGVCTSRTLISNDNLEPMVRVINISKEPVNIRSGTTVSELHEVEVVDVQSKHTDSDYEHLDVMMEKVDPAVPDEIRNELYELLKKYSWNFSKNEYDLGCAKGVQHHIDTGSARPFRQTLRRHPDQYLPLIDEQVELMLQQGIIEPSKGAYFSNIVLVKKKMDPFDRV